MKQQKTKHITSDYQTLSIFLILGVLTVTFVLGLRWVFMAPGLGPAATQIAPAQEIGASK